MTGEKRVVRVGVTDIRVLLQAQLQRTTLVPETIGEGFVKRPAKSWQGIGRSDANALAVLICATNATAALRAAAARAPPPFDSTKSAVMSGRRAVISCSRFADWIGSGVSTRRMASAKARTRRWAAMSLSDRPVWTFGAANTSLISARAAIPTTIAAPRLTPAEKMFCGESICVTATRATV